MKRHIYISGIIVLILGIFFVGSTNGKTKTPGGSGVLSVSDIQADPSAFKGTITIIGVVAAVFKEDPKLFAIIDTKEAKLCKSTGCAKFYLPVQYERQIPNLWDEVNVTGNFEGGDPNFRAINVDVLRHLTFGDKQ